MLFSAPGVLT